MLKNTIDGAVRSSRRWPSLGAALGAARPHHWIKNALLFVPILTAHEVDFETVGTCLVAFAAFGLAASSGYLVNDLLDLPFDRRHPRKRARPLAAGLLAVGHGMALAAGLLVAAFVLAFAKLPMPFLVVLGCYCVLAFAYSLGLKRLPLVDVGVLAGLYTLRVVAGGMATGIAISPWLLAFSMFVFLSLAIVKRLAELVEVGETGGRGVPGRGYRTDDLPVVRSMGIASGYISVAVMALYIASPAVEPLYASPVFLWGLCPLLLFWISRMYLLAHRGELPDDPFVFATRDYVTLAVGVAMLMLILAGVWL